MSGGDRLTAVQVDDRHELLVNKLCALVSRSELRDLGDVKAPESRET